MLQQDRDAFDAAARAHLAELMSVGRRLTGDERSAAHLVQDALERALMRWKRIKDDDPAEHIVRLMMSRQRSLLDRIRRAPLEPVPTPEPGVPMTEDDVDELLAAVHRRARHRRQGRIGVIAAGVLAVLTTTGVIPSPGGAQGQAPGEQPTAPSPIATVPEDG